MSRILDSDHIGGVLRLLEDELDWRIYDHHQARGDNSVKKPDAARPPEIGAIWHNAFRDQVGDDAEDIADLLAAAAPALLASDITTWQEAGEGFYTIATSVKEAIKVSKIVSPRLLGIPVNAIPGAPGPAKLLMVRPGAKAIKIGSMSLKIVGPTKQQLGNLRMGWQTWLRANQKAIKEINNELERRRQRFASGIDSGAVDLRDWNGVPDIKGVTAPNIASLVFMVEEDGKRLLLTGDAQHDLILEGLEATGFLEEGSLHLDVLKVQHHGSENNLDWRFASVVSADHYVFCGNGAHGNPDPRVIKDVVNSRLGQDPARLAKSDEAANRPFKLWFSTSASAGTGSPSNQAHMKEIETLVRQMAKSSKGQMTFHLNTKPFTTLPI